MIPAMRAFIILFIAVIGSAARLPAQNRVVLVRDPAVVTGWLVEPVRAHAMLVCGAAPVGSPTGMPAVASTPAPVKRSA